MAGKKSPPAVRPSYYFISAPMKIHHRKPAGQCPRLTLAVLAALTAASFADTLKLKDGRVLEGRASDVTPTSVKFEWRPSPSVREEQVFQKSDIAELKVQSPDEVAVIELRKLMPTPDLTSPTTYKQAVEQKLKPFVAKFPTSPFIAEVNTILKTYEEELDKVSNGWLKLDGVWITPEENTWNKYIIESRVIRKEMEVDIKNKNIKDALDKVAKLEKEYAATPSYVEALDLYAKMLDDYEKDVLRQQQEQPGLIKEREDRLKTLDKQEASAVDLELKKAASDFKLKIADEKARGIRIPSADPTDMKSLKDTQTSITRERLRIQNLLRDRKKYEEASSLVVRGLAEGGKGNPALAFTMLDEASKKLNMDSKLRTMRETWKKTADEAAKSGMPVKTATDLPPSASGGDKPAPPKPPEKSGDKKPETKKPVSADAEKEKPKVAAEPKPKFGVPEEEPETDYTLPLLGGAGALVLAGIGYTLMSKRKKKSVE